MGEVLASTEEAAGEVSDVFVYNELPRALRTQICHILARCLGFDPQGDFAPRNPAYRTLRQQIAEELGVFSIGNLYEANQAAVFNFFTKNATDEEAIDIIEIAFRCVIHFQQNTYNLSAFQVEEGISDSIAALNRRFLEHGVGYAFVADGTNLLIRRDNEHLHKAAVLPALQLLHNEAFEGANDEYRSAHNHYRKGNHKECLNDCLKAFESTLKTICKRKKWKFDEKKDTASQLIDICVSNDLIPSFMSSHFGVIKSLLSSGGPTVRNKMGGHGQGETQVDVPAYFAEFLLNETAATIVFLVKAFKG
jgi:hypothetical protein